MNYSMYQKYFAFALCCVVAGMLYSCKSTEPAISGRTTGTVTADSLLTSNVKGLNLAAYRNKLGDQYTTRQHDLPPFFMRSSDGSSAVNSDPFDGFRIQVISTRNVALADSVARSFRIWSDTTLVGYQPEAYVFFKQPHYKVHVGDFNSRERANIFSRLVKRRYPDAWVVHDRINPYEVPADTVKIQLKSEMEQEEPSTPGDVK